MIYTHVKEQSTIINNSIYNACYDNENSYDIALKKEGRL